jgi:ribosomal protein L35AE/L33A
MTLYNPNIPTPSLPPPLSSELTTHLHSRLYSKGRVLGHKRAKRNTRPNTSLIQIEGVATKEDAQFYLGKRIAYVYRAKREIQGSKVRVIWGCVFPVVVLFFFWGGS